MITATLVVRDFLTDQILISRESARLLEQPLREVGKLTESDQAASHTLAVDFKGVEGIAPSFVDELVRIFESIISPSPGGSKRQLLIMNPPTRLSSKFEAIARSHALEIELRSDGAWALSDRCEVKN